AAAPALPVSTGVAGAQAASSRLTAITNVRIRVARFIFLLLLAHATGQTKGPDHQIWLCPTSSPIRAKRRFESAPTRMKINKGGLARRFPFAPHRTRHARPARCP